MTDATGPELRLVVLREQPYAGVGEVLDLLSPGGSAQLPDPNADTETMRLSGVDVTLQIGREPLAARELEYAVAQSPLKPRIEPAVARHGGYTAVSIDPGDDLFAGIHLLTNLGAYLADDGGLVVWMPDADLVTTDVMYLGDLDERPAVLAFNTMAAKLDESTAIAHTIGVQQLGGIEVQLRSTTLGPGDAYQALRGAVAGRIEAQSLPKPGETLEIGGVSHVLTRRQHAGPRLDPRRSAVDVRLRRTG